MRTNILLLSLFILTGAAIAGEPTLKFHVQVPISYSLSTVGTPTGESEYDRYKEGYESFWMNCVAVRAQNIRARCPLGCSGTAGASDGCSAGALDADNQIDDLLRHYSEVAVQDYLKSFMAQPDMLSKFKKGRFHGDAAAFTP